MTCSHAEWFKLHPLCEFQSTLEVSKGWSPCWPLGPGTQSTYWIYRIVIPLNSSSHSLRLFQPTHQQILSIFSNSIYDSQRHRCDAATISWRCRYDFHTYIVHIQVLQSLCGKCLTRCPISHACWPMSFGWIKFQWLCLPFIHIHTCSSIPISIPQTSTGNKIEPVKSVIHA